MQVGGTQSYFARSLRYHLVLNTCSDYIQATIDLTNTQFEVSLAPRMRLGRVVSWERGSICLLSKANCNIRYGRWHGTSVQLLSGWALVSRWKLLGLELWRSCILIFNAAGMWNIVVVDRNLMPKAIWSTEFTCHRPPTPQAQTKNERISSTCRHFPTHMSPRIFDLKYLKCSVNKGFTCWACKSLSSSSRFRW